MRTHYHGAFDPFRLEHNVLYFHDWRWVFHGATRWVDEAAEPWPLWSAKPVPDLRWAGVDVPSGIRLRALPASKGEPFLRPEAPWEGAVGAPTVLHEAGRYRLWYEAVPREHFSEPLAGQRNLLCLAESDDAVHWRRVPAAQHRRPDWPANNIVYGGPLSGERGYHGGCVFVDPSAPPEERYKAFHLGLLAPEEFDRYASNRPGEVDPFCGRQRARGRPVHAMFGAVSPDGVRWRALPDPLVLQVSDTQNIAYYDAQRRAYVGYFRTWVLGRRAVGRAETTDYRRFPLPETILWPDASVGPSDLWYANGRTAMPDAPDHHLLFAKRWRLAEDRFHVHLATSPDGILWGFPPEGPVVSPGEGRAPDAGGVSVGCGMVHLPGGRTGVPVIEYRVPHKYSREAPMGAFAWATWEKDRLVALEAPEEGAFRTWKVVPETVGGGCTLRINARTRHVGEIRVEVVGPDGAAMPGRGFEECDPIRGDVFDRQVSWRGEAGIALPSGAPLALRFRMRAAELFSVRFDGRGTRRP